MKTKNILLISCLKNLTNSSVLTGARRPEQLSLAYLAAPFKKNGFTVSILSGEIEEQNFLEIVEKNHPFIVGFSVYTYAYNYSLSLARAAKKKANSLGYSISIIFGGYHASNLPYEVASKKEVDFVVKGEGDETFLKLATAIYNNNETNNIKGIIYRDNKNLVKTPPRERITNLDLLPLPDRNILLTSDSKRGELIYPPPSEQTCSAQIIFSRGCPFSCSFCDSKNTWGNKVAYRSSKAVVDELEMLHSKHNVNLAIFLDLTFNANKEKVLEICSELIKRDLTIHWTAMARADLFTEEILRTMAKAKCSKINIGIESPICDVSNDIKDSYNTNSEKIHQMLESANNFGILIRAFLVIGFLKDTKNSLEAYSKELTSLPIDELRVTIATPFPGTQLWEACRKQNILTKEPNWDKFTTEELVFDHPNFTKNEIKTVQKKIVKDFFMSHDYSKHVLKKITEFPKLRKSWIEFLTFLSKEENNIFKGDTAYFTDFIHTIKNA